MPIESLSIMYLGIGVLFAVFICVAVQTIADRTTKLRVGQEKDAVNLLRPQPDALKADVNAHHLNLPRAELDALKADLNSLRTKLEMVTYSTKLTEHPSLVPVPPTTSQLLLEETWSRGNTWSRDEPLSDASIIPTADQSPPGDTWTRDERISDFSVPPTLSRSTSEDTWIRDDSTPASPDRSKGATLLTGVAFSQRETPHLGRTRRIA
jgi:hypothetical protein